MFRCGLKARLAGRSSNLEAHVVSRSFSEAVRVLLRSLCSMPHALCGFSPFPNALRLLWFTLCSMLYAVFLPSLTPYGFYGLLSALCPMLYAIFLPLLILLTLPASLVNVEPSLPIECTAYFINIKHL